MTYMTVKTDVYNSENMVRKESFEFIGFLRFKKVPLLPRYKMTA